MERCQSSTDDGQLITVDARSMRDRFKEATCMPSTSLTYDYNGESRSLLFENEWIRLLLVNLQKDQSHVLIEVELSLPESPFVGNQQESRKILQRSIEYFRYLEKLVEYKFNLTVADRDCLWIASKLVAKDTHDLSFFELLIGP